jgi:hypothetical protein
MDNEICVDFFHTGLHIALGGNHFSSRSCSSQVKVFRRRAVIVKHSPTGDWNYSASSNLCLANQTNHMLLGIFLWIIPLAFDVLVVILTTSKVYQNTALLKGPSRSPIVRPDSSMVSAPTESRYPNFPSCIFCFAMECCEHSDL